MVYYRVAIINKMSILFRVSNYFTIMYNNFLYTAGAFFMFSISAPQKIMSPLLDQRSFNGISCLLWLQSSFINSRVCLPVRRKPKQWAKRDKTTSCFTSHQVTRAHVNIRKCWLAQLPGKVTKWVKHPSITRSEAAQNGSQDVTHAYSISRLGVQ